MSLDPQARAFLDEAADAGGSPPWETSIVQFRADFEAFWARLEIGESDITATNSPDVLRPS